MIRGGNLTFDDLLVELDKAWDYCRKQFPDESPESLDRQRMTERCAAYKNVRNFIKHGGNIEDES